MGRPAACIIVDHPRDWVHWFKLSLGLESVVMGLRPGSAWMDMNPGSTETNQALSSNGVVPASESIGAGPVPGWGRSLVSLELAWS